MHILRPLLACGALIAFGSGYALQDEAPSLNPQLAVILPPGSARSLVKQCTRVVPSHIEGAWQPTTAQVAAFETALAPVLRLALRRSVRPSARGFSVRDYYRQYGGLVVDGKQIIYVRSEEHTSELQSLTNLVCRLLLEKKKNKKNNKTN